MSQSYEVEITQAAAHRLARETAQSSNSPTFLVNLAIDAMDNLLSSANGRKKLHAALDRLGFDLVERPDKAEKPAKASKSVDEDDDPPAARPRKKVEYTARDRQDADADTSPRAVLSKCKNPERRQQIKETRGGKQPRGHSDANYPEQSVNGPKLKELIAKHNLDNDRLWNLFSMLDDEIEWKDAEQWENFSRRSLHELVSDIESHFAPKRAKPEKVPQRALSGSERDRLSNRLGPRLYELIQGFGMTKDVLKSLFEFNNRELDALEASRWNAFEIRRLGELVDAVEIAGLQPAAEVPTEFHRENLMVDIAILTRLFEIDGALLNAAKIDPTQARWIEERDTNSFTGRELFDCLEGLKRALLKRLES